MLNHGAAALRSAVLTELRGPADAPPDDAAFDRLARRIFEHQFEHNRPYAAYCERRGRTPGAVKHWTEIPPVPTAAFREVPLTAGDPAHADIVFRTSGTTGGVERRGTHYVLDASLYEASLLPCFAAHVLPDGKRPRMIAFIPPRAQLPDSSLAYMVDVVMRELGAPGSTYVVDAERGVDFAAVDVLLTDAVQNGEAVCLLGTSFSFVHLLDKLTADTRSYMLPPGSRLMDTGGYKGRSREVPAEELRTLYQRVLGLEPAYCVNEYGMTELSSQYYDATLLDAVRSDANRPRRKSAPPWLRARVVDPESL
ncbi:MAG: long-chain fatty acid--CoA ligase, partial [Longimicrobiales bacterium]